MTPHDTAPLAQQPVRSSALPRIALIGDRNPAIVAHQGVALSLQARAEAHWLGTETLPGDATEMRQRLSGYHGVWCLPGSPYRKMEAALAAIQVAREDGIPFIGTCGGFQHAVIEFTRNVLGRQDADHAESNPEAEMPVITQLACSLVGQTGTVRFKAGSRLADAAGASESNEGYHCSYGITPAYRPLFDRSGLRFTAFDAKDEVRGLELDGHLFFLATLFQPERAALPRDPATAGKGRVHPLVLAFVGAARAYAATRTVLA
jgi:CTP synthase (UTP-ammonia lyase)